MAKNFYCVFCLFGLLVIAVCVTYVKTQAGHGHGKGHGHGHGTGATDPAYYYDYYYDYGPGAAAAGAAGAAPQTTTPAGAAVEFEPPEYEGAPTTTTAEPTTTTKKPKKHRRRRPKKKRGPKRRRKTTPAPTTTVPPTTVPPPTVAQARQPSGRGQHQQNNWGGQGPAANRVQDRTGWAGGQTQGGTGGGGWSGGSRQDQYRASTDTGRGHGGGQSTGQQGGSSNKYNGYQSSGRSDMYVNVVATRAPTTVKPTTTNNYREMYQYQSHSCPKMDVATWANEVVIYDNVNCAIIIRMNPRLRRPTVTFQAPYW